MNWTLLHPLISRTHDVIPAVGVAWLLPGRTPTQKGPVRTHNELELSSTQALNLIKKCILWVRSILNPLSGQQTGTQCNQELREIFAYFSVKIYVYFTPIFPFPIWSEILIKFPKFSLHHTHTHTALRPSLCLFV